MGNKTNAIAVLRETLHAPTLVVQLKAPVESLIIMNKILESIMEVNMTSMNLMAIWIARYLFTPPNCQLRENLLFKLAQGL
jgi:hypothetical protein